MTRITRSYVAPNPKEFDYWVDLAADPKGNVIKYYAGGSKWLPLNDDTDNDQSARIAALESGKVDKVEGKELSSNDFTDAYRDKLGGIAQGANKYVLPTATASALGGVKIGSNITLANGGTISITKNNVTSALGVDPTTTYVRKAGDTMTGILNIKNSEGAQLELFSTASDGGAYMRFYPNNQTDNKWYLGVGTNQTLNLGYNTVTKASFGDGQLSLTTSANLAPIKTNSTTLCANLNADMVDGYHSDQFSQSKSNKSLLTSSNDNIYFKIIELTRNTATADSVYIKYGITVRATSAVNYSNITLYGDIEIFGSFSSTVVNYKVRCSSDFANRGRLRAYVKGDNLQIWYVGYIWENVATYKKTERNVDHFIVNYNIELASALPNTSIITIEGDQLEDWYGVSWSETSSNPDCTRIGNMEMHRTLPIQSMMKPFAFQTDPSHKEQFVPMKENFSVAMYSHTNNAEAEQVASTVNIMIRIPEFWYTDEYVPSSKTHNLKICPHAKPGWYHHKEAYVSAYEAFNFGNKGRLISMKSAVPTVNFTRTNGRTWARANGFDGEAKWNLYTYEEHRAICHLFLVEYATRNSQKAVNTELTPEGFRQGGLGSGCTTGTATINGAQTWSFIPTGSSDSLGSGSGEVTVTIQQTDSSGSNTSTITRKCNRYRGIENPFGHIWKHTDDIISIYEGSWRTYYKSIKPDQFATNKNNSYKPLTSAAVVTGHKTEIRATPTCDFFAEACTNDSETTYWCDYNWSNTDTSEHCLLIGGNSGDGGRAGLFALSSNAGVGGSGASVGSRLTYLPWAE